MQIAVFDEDANTYLFWWKNFLNYGVIPIMTYESMDNELRKYNLKIQDSILNGDEADVFDFLMRWS